MRLALTLLAALALGLAVLVWALNFGGGLTAPAIADPGAVVRIGLPIAKVIFDFSSAIAIGTLVFASFALNETDGLLSRALNLAAGASASWVISGLVYFVFTYASVSGTAISGSNAFGNGLWLFATSIEMGQSIALNIIGGVLLTILALAIQRLTGTILIAALGLAALVPLALIGHSAGTRGHAMAVNSMGMHLWAIVIWVGGLVALLALKSTDSNRNAILAKRFSSLALVSFVLVAISGVGAASVRIESPSDLFGTPYGFLLLGKVFLLTVLGIFGAVNRTRQIKKIEAASAAEGRGGSAGFWRLASVEIAIMAMAMGLATALSRTATPAGDDTINPTPAYLLTGEQLPPELTAASFFDTWKIDLVWLVITLGAIGFYLAGVRRLNRRGDKWPWLRTASWITGMLTLLYVTNGAINAYQEYLFSIHMIGHMILAMAIPVLLVPGAPVTLLMRSVEARHDGSRGAREWVLWAVHTKYAQFISHPIIAAVLFASSLVTFYYTPLFSWADRKSVV